MITDFREQVKNDSLWIDESQIMHLPGVIQKEYELLRESIEKDDIFGSVFRLKDIYETCLKIPVIIAMIVIDSAIKRDDTYVPSTSEQLMQEKNAKIQENACAQKNDEEVLLQFRKIMAKMLRKPLSIGSWAELLSSICKCAGIFGFHKYLTELLNRTSILQRVQPHKNTDEERYDSIGNWRNKVIGHGTLMMDADIYWLQAYDLLEGLQAYFSKTADGVSVDDLYSHIYFEESDGIILNIAGKRYRDSEFVYEIDREKFFFDSYFNDQKYVEVTNYLSDTKRIDGNVYFQSRYQECFFNTENKQRKVREKIADSEERKAFACLNRTPHYEKPQFLINEIRQFMNDYSKGILYIQMERGMGKSTLAHHLDGRYQKGILQHDLNAIVRVYHIRDTLLRTENRIVDFYTSLDENLRSFDGKKRLEVDEEEYEMPDGRNLKQEIRKGEACAGQAFIEYLNLFRKRYEEELVGECEDQKLVYIIDGIDELNYDTENLLDSLPTNEQFRKMPDADRVYIIILSRLKTEETLTPTSAACIQKCEEMSGEHTLTVDGNNKQYVALLKRYIKSNFSGITEKACKQIIEKSHRKFLYVQPYIAMGDVIFQSGGKVTTAVVAENYIKELLKRYWGVSQRTLYLMFASIAVFGNIRLEEICHLILFHGVSFDAIGCMNDILPLLTVKRSDGADVYEYANEEFQKAVERICESALPEVIRRFRISLISWYDSVDQKSDGYEGQWAFYVKKLLLADEYAQRLNMQNEEVYIKAVLNMRTKVPETVYGNWISGVLKIHIFKMLKTMDFTSLNEISEVEVYWLNVNLQDGSIWNEPYKDEIIQCKAEFINKLIDHCRKHQRIDVWFQKIILKKTNLNFLWTVDLIAFERIVKVWHDEKMVDYLIQSVRADLTEEKEQSYVVYLEVLLDVVEDEQIENKILCCLIDAYRFYVEKNSGDSGRMSFADIRREKMMKVLEKAQKSGLFEQSELEQIGEMLDEEDVFRRAVCWLQRCYDNMGDIVSETLLDQISTVWLSPVQFDKMKDENNLYGNACIAIVEKLLQQVETLYQEQEYKQVHTILSHHELYRLLEMCKKTETEVLERWLFLYSMDARRLWNSDNVAGLEELQGTFRRAMRCYDEHIKEKPTGIGTSTGAEIWSPEEEWEKIYPLKYWEEDYILCCEVCGSSVPICDNKGIEYRLTRGMVLLLQELFRSGDMEAYYALNRQIEAFYCKYGFVEMDLKGEIICYESSRYMYWLKIRYDRSLQGYDHRTDAELYEVLKKEYQISWNYLRNCIRKLKNGADTSECSWGIVRNTIRMFELVKLIPDSIVCLEDAKEAYFDEMNAAKKKRKDSRLICEWIDQQLKNMSE